MNTYEILAQEIWLVEKTYKCPIIDAIDACEDFVSLSEVDNLEFVLKKRLTNSYLEYPDGFKIIWIDFPKSDIFKVIEVQLVSTSTFSINDSLEDAEYCYEEKYLETTDYEILEPRFIDKENYYKKGFEIIEIKLI